jgi:hypothetical protein
LKQPRFPLKLSRASRRRASFADGRALACDDTQIRRLLALDKGNGLCDFRPHGLSKVSQELAPDYIVEVYLNGEQVLAKQMTSADAASAQTFVVNAKARKSVTHLMCASSSVVAECFTFHQRLCITRTTKRRPRKAARN